MVPDFPDLMAAWGTSNTLDPKTIKASSPEKVGWLCPVHLSHRWTAAIRDRATYKPGCPYCMDRLACPTNSVAAP